MNILESQDQHATMLQESVDRWGKEGYLEGIASEKHLMTSVLLDNQAKEIKRLQEATTTPAISTYNKLLLPIARRVIPNLIAPDLFGVQPMLGPTSQVFSLQMVTSNAIFIDFGTNAAATTAKSDFDAKAAKSNNSGITGGVAVVTGTIGNFVAGAGTDINNVGQLGTFTAAGSGTGVQFPAGAEIGYLNLLQFAGKASTSTLEQAAFWSDGGVVSEIEARVGTATVTAETRKLRARWTFEAAQDANNLHGIDLQEELVAALANEIRREIDYNLINNAKAAAIAYAVDLNTVATSNTWQAEKYRALYQQIVYAAQQIAVNTRRGPANWMITSPKMVAALSSLSNFSFNQVSGNLNKFADGAVTFVGTLDGRIKVYQNPMASDDNVLLGFKGASVLECGQVYAPYVPLSISETIIDPTTLTPRIGVMTRYGVVTPTQILSGGSYYAYISLSNSTTGTQGVLDI